MGFVFEIQNMVQIGLLLVVLLVTYFNRKAGAILVLVLSLVYCMFTFTEQQNQQVVVESMENIVINENSHDLDEYLESVAVSEVDYKKELADEVAAQRLKSEQVSK